MSELNEIYRSRNSLAMRSLDSYDRAERLERPEVYALEGEGRRGRLEIENRDLGGLTRRYQRWFPPAADSRTKSVSPRVGTLEADDLESLIVVLASIAEVAESVSSDSTLSTCLSACSPMPGFRLPGTSAS